MNPVSRLVSSSALLAIVFGIAACSAARAGDCVVREIPAEKNAGARLVLENDRVSVEISPDEGGAIKKFAAKAAGNTPLIQSVTGNVFTPNNPFVGRCTYKIDANGPERAAVTLSHRVLSKDIKFERLIGEANPEPFELSVSQTISIDRDSTKLTVETNVTNLGKGVAPDLVVGLSVKFGPQKGDKSSDDVRWFLPTSSASDRVELFDKARGERDMEEANYGEGAPIHHRFSAFTPGESASKPRYAAGGWAAVAAGAGRAYLHYDAANSAYMEYAFLDHPMWQLFLDPRDRAEDLKPGATRANNCTLALDAADIGAELGAVALMERTLPAVINAGDTVKLKLHASFAKPGFSDHATAQLIVKREAGGLGESNESEEMLTFVAGRAETPMDVYASEISNAELICAISEAAPAGPYRWTLTVNGRTADSGPIEIAPKVVKPVASVIQMTPERLEKLKKGGDWWYDQLSGGAATGSLHLTLKYDDAAKTFTIRQTKNEMGAITEVLTVFSADVSPQLKRFSVTRSGGRETRGELTGAVLSGVDMDGDAYTLAWRPNLLCETAVLFAVMAMDWNRAHYLSLSVFDPDVQDILPAETLVPWHERKTPRISGEQAVECSAVKLHGAIYDVDANGRIVEISDASRPDVWRLTTAPKVVTAAKKADEPEPVDDALAQALSEKISENPPATGQLVQMAMPRALRAGLLPGDIITMYDGQSVETYAKLRAASIRARDAQKSSVDIQYFRDAETRKTTVAVGQIGIQCCSVEKGKAVDLEDAQFGGMGFGPGPKPPPTALEKLAREKCGSQIHWLSDYDKALAQAVAEKKLILWWASPIHGSSMYRLKMFRDYMNMGPFSTPEVVQYINKHFVPYSAPLTKKEMDGFALKKVHVPALLFVGADGKLIHEVDGITSFEPELFLAHFNAVVAKVAPAASANAETNAQSSPEYLKGLELAAQHRADDAAALFKSALAKSGDAAQAGAARAELAWLHIHSNHPDRALEVLQKDTELAAGPRAAESRFAEGVALLLLNRDMEARDVWKKTAEKYPDDPWGWRAAAESEGLGPISRGVENPGWIDLSDIEKAKTIADLPHSTVPLAHATEPGNAEFEGVGYLLDHQAADGGWNDTYYEFGNLKAMPNVRTAVTAICAEALLANRQRNPERVDRALQKAWEYLSDPKRMTWNDKNEIIWAHFYKLNFFAAWLPACKPELQTKLRQEMQTISTVLTRDNIQPDGFFRHEYENEFVTASVLTSLRIVKDLGISVDEGAVRRACEAIESVRTSRGTIPYDTNPNPNMAWKGSVGRSLNCEAALFAWGRGTPERLKFAIEQYLRYNFVQDRVQKESFHNDHYGDAGFFYWYNQHMFSQTLRLTDAETARTAREFLRNLILSKREVDGTWVDSLELGKTYATGMALIALKAAEEK